MYMCLFRLSPSVALNNLSAPHIHQATMLWKP